MNRVAPILQSLATEPARDVRELWNYTNTTALAQYDFTAPTVAAEPRFLSDAAHIACVNGVWQVGALPEGCLFADGVLIVNADAVVECLNVIGASEVPVMTGTTLTIRVGQGAKLDFLDHAQSDGEPALHQQILTFDVAQRATLNHVRLNDLPDSDYWFTRTGVAIAADATYTYTARMRGAAQTRHQLDVSLQGDRAQAHFIGATRIAGRQSADHTLTITHDALNTNSTQKFRAVVDGESKSAFQGKVVVAEGAAKTDARQLHKGLILSPRATVDAKPELEILNDDVACSHGATCGALDEEALFYMRARGLPEDVARRLLTDAFIAEVLQDAPAFAELLHDA